LLNILLHRATGKERGSGQDLLNAEKVRL